MTNSDSDQDHTDETQHNLTGTPSGEKNDEQADTASGGAPDDPDDVDPQTGTNPDGQPIDNPGG